MASSANKRRKIAKITLGIAIPILILSIAMVFAFNAIYNNILKKDIALGEDTLVTKVWKDIPLPIYEKIYFFNITNGGDFLKGKKLNVVEVGPYTYKSKWVKPDPKWNENNTVTYREIRTYEFVPELSNGTQDDVIFSLNAPMILASDIVKDYLWIVRKGLSIFFGLNDEYLIIQKSVRELVYDGYEDAIIKDSKYVKDVPFKEGKFSWLYGKNASDDGLFTVHTGVDDASKTNIISNWNGEDKLNFWKGDSCNSINGCTSIEHGPPINGEAETYTFFQSIFCRSLTFNYSKDTSHYDIPAKRFKSTYSIFANGTENPDNTCFEVHQEYPSGILDVSPCQFGAPVFISFPHFYLADTSYVENVDGLCPNETYHDSNIDVEPITGLTIDITVRLQLNIKVKNDGAITQFGECKDGLYPVLWVELSEHLDEKMADFLKSNVRRPKIIAYSVIVAVAGVCLIAIIVSALVLAFTSKDVKDECLIKDERDFKNKNNVDKSVDNPTNVDDFPKSSFNIPNEMPQKSVEYQPVQNIYPSL